MKLDSSWALLSRSKPRVNRPVYLMGKDGKVEVGIRYYNSEFRQYMYRMNWGGENDGSYVYAWKYV